MAERRRRFEALVRPILGDLYRFARRLTRDPVRAEDLLQQSLLTGLDRLDQLHDDGAFKVWQSRILFRTHLNERARRKDMLMEPDQLERKVIPLARGPHEAAEQRQLGASLATALDDLPDEQRQVVWLVDGQGHTYAQAAEILGIAPGTAASRVARGRLALRSALRSIATEQGVIR